MVLTRALILLGVLTAVVAGCGSGSSDRSSDLEHSIKTTGAQQLKSALRSLGSSGTVSMNDASCKRASGTQQYSCLVHYRVNDPANGENNQRYQLNVSGTCESSGNCRWHATGNGTRVAG